LKTSVVAQLVRDQEAAVFAEFGYDTRWQTRKAAVAVPACTVYSEIMSSEVVTTRR
jgi:hypothetical protein